MQGTQVRVLLVVVFLTFGDARRTQEFSRSDSGADVEHSAIGFRFNKGPVCNARGNICFSEIPNQRIHRGSKNEKLATFRDNSSSENGQFFDSNGHLLASEDTARRVTRMKIRGQQSEGNS